MNHMVGSNFLEGTPDTFPYMIAGFAVIFGFMLIYIVSLAVRSRRLHHEEDMLKELDEGKNNIPLR